MTNDDKIKNHLLTLQSHLLMLVEDDNIPHGARELLKVMTVKNHKFLTNHYHNWSLKAGEFPPSRKSKMGLGWNTNFKDYL